MRYIDNFNLFELTNFLTEKESGLCVLTGKLEAFSLVKSAPIIDLTRQVKVKDKGDIKSTISAAVLPAAPSSSKLFVKKEIKEATIGDANDVMKTDIAIVKIENNFESAPLPPFIQRRRSNSTTNGGSFKKSLRGRTVSLGDLGEPSSKRLLFDLISTLDEFFPDYDFDTTKPEQFLVKDINQVIQMVNGYLAELTEERPNFLEKLWQGIDDIINLRKCEAYSLVPDMSEDPFSDGTLWSFNYFFLNHEIKQIIYFTCVAKR
jgi:hypothetical protein